MLELEHRDQLIIRLYDSILAPDTALDAIETLNHWLDCDGIHLIGWNKQTQDFSISVATRELSANAGQYSSHHRQIDPRWDAVRACSEGFTIACQDLFDKRYVDRSEFYQDLLMPRGLRYIFGGVLRQDEDEEVVIAFNHQLGRPAFCTEKRQQMQSLFPFLVSWLKQLRHTDGLRRAAWAGETGLAALEQGVVLLNQARKVLYLNKAAERCFPNHIVGNTTRRGLIGDRQLEDTIRRVQLSRYPTSLQLSPHTGDVPCVINILPVPQAGYSHGALLPGFSSRDELAAQAGRSHPQGLHLHPRGDVILLIRPKHRQTAASATSLAELFALTPAESRLARALALGAGTEHYAQEHGLSINTVRSQIRALLAKTGEDSLQRLQRLLSALPAI